MTTRAEQWAAAWHALYMERLPRDQHDPRRDEMLAWADARGPAEAAACRAGQTASMSTADVDLLDTLDIPFPDRK